MGYEQIVPDYKKYLEIQMRESFGSKSSAADNLLKAHRRYVTHVFDAIGLPSSLRESMDIKVLDAGCNDGLGLRSLREMFPVGDIAGLDLDPKKVALAVDAGFPAFVCDANFIEKFNDPGFVGRRPFALIYCTHVLEHIYYPKKLAKYFYDSLVGNGYLFVVLPYPAGDSDGHGGSLELGICQAPGLAHSTPYDDGKAVTEFFKSVGFSIIDKRYDTFREPEIWLLLQKKGT